MNFKNRMMNILDVYYEWFSKNIPETEKKLNRKEIQKCMTLIHQITDALYDKLESDKSNKNNG